MPTSPQKKPLIEYLFLAAFQAAGMIFVCFTFIGQAIWLVLCNIIMFIALLCCMIIDLLAPVYLAIWELFMGHDADDETNHRNHRK